MVRPDPLSRSVKKRSAVVIRHPEANVALDENAALGRSRGAAFQLIRVTLACLRRRCSA